ncbi:MAG: IS6 family transposase [Holophaga sp.]|jgi:transposase-like protein
MSTSTPFKGRHFPSSVILLCVRWYLAYSLSYRDLQEIMAERGIEVDASTIYRWVQAYAPELDRRLRRNLKPTQGNWHVDETYIRIKGVWHYLYRAVDAAGQSVDFRLSKHRDTLAAMAFFENAILRPHNDSPETLVVDRNPSYPVALELLKKSGHLSPTAQLKTGRALNNLIEQDHRRIKRLVRPGLGFKRFDTARRTLQGYETMSMIRKGQVEQVQRRDGKALATFVEALFRGVA